MEAIRIVRKLLLEARELLMLCSGKMVGNTCVQ